MNTIGHSIGPDLAPGEHPFCRGWEWDDTVKACEHNAWESVLVLANSGRVEECVRCASCHAPRCGHTNDPDPCQLVRHHTTHHVHLSGRLDPLGGYKCTNGTSCGCGARYAR